MVNTQSVSPATRSTISLMIYDFLGGLSFQGDTRPGTYHSFRARTSMFAQGAARSRILSMKSPGASASK